RHYLTRIFCCATLERNQACELLDAAVRLTPSTLFVPLWQVRLAEGVIRHSLDKISSLLTPARLSLITCTGNIFRFMFLVKSILCIRRYIWFSNRVNQVGVQKAERLPRNRVMVVLAQRKLKNLPLALIIRAP